MKSFGSWLYVSKRLHAHEIPDDPPAWRVTTYWFVESGKPVLMYRMTPEVYAWLFRALDALGERLTADVLAEWNRIHVWASQHLDAEDVARAMRAKSVELPPPATPWESLELQDAWISRAMKADDESKKAYEEWLERMANKKRFEEVAE